MFPSCTFVGIEDRVLDPALEIEKKAVILKFKSKVLKTL